MAVPIALFVLTLMTAGFYVMYTSYRDHVLGLLSEQAESSARLIRLGVESEMLHHQEDGELVRNMVTDIAKEFPFERLMILDRQGMVSYSTDPAIEERHFDVADPTC